MTWALVWRFAKSWWGGAAFGSFAALVAVAILSARSTSAPGPAPYTAEATKRAAAADKVVEDLAVQTLKPDQKTRQKIAGQYRQPGILAPTAAAGELAAAAGPIDGRLIAGSAFAKEILAEVRFEPAPAGGTALTTVDRATGIVETSLRPSPEPRISFGNRWRVVGSYGQFEDQERLIRAQVEWWPVKVRRLELGGAAGWERTDRVRAYVVAQLALVPR